MPFLVGAVAFLVQASVEIEVNAVSGVRLTEQDAALTVRQIGDCSERMWPQLVLRRRVVDQVEDVIGSVNGKVQSHSPSSNSMPAGAVRDLTSQGHHMPTPHCSASPLRVRVDPVALGSSCRINEPAYAHAIGK